MLRRIDEEIDEMTTPVTQVIRTLRSQKLPDLSNLMRGLGLDAAYNGDARLTGADPILRSPHHLSEATAYTLLLEVIAAAAIWKHRTGTANENLVADIDVHDAIRALHSTHFLWHNGYALTVGAELVPTNGIFRCADGRYIMTEAGPPYTKLERGYLNFFDCGNNRESIGREIAKYDAEDLQEKLSALGLPACIAYEADEWRRHPQGQALLTKPVIEIEKIGDGQPHGLKPGCSFPLDGIKVVDFTHVLAGPRSMRSLAQYGADVMHISSPYHRDTISQNLLVNMGKRSAYLYLTLEEDRQKMKRLLSKADVFACSYRPSVAERFGLSPAELAKEHPGIICLSVNAYGFEGPWKARPGFDQNAQVATGFAATEGRGGAPTFSPVFYLNDFLTGYLAASGVMTALLKRATDGGSYHVKVSLARTAMWVQDLGLLPESAFEDAPEKDEFPTKLRTVDTRAGRVTELAPAVTVEGLPHKELDKLQPFGVDQPEWLPVCRTRGGALPGVDVDDSKDLLDRMEQS